MQLGVISKPRGGVGGWLGPDTGQSLASWCASWESLTSPSQLYCLGTGVDAQNVVAKVTGTTTPAPPPPPPPGVTFSAAAKDDTSILAGHDAEGNAVYVTPQSPQDNIQQYTQQLQQFFADAEKFPAPVDCSGFWASLFNPSCPSTSATWVVPLLVIGGLALFAGGMVGKVRH